MNASLAAAVAAGGAVGALARWTVGVWLDGPGAWLPWGTLTVNVLGALLLGYVYASAHPLLTSPHARHVLAVGFLGSFTTFSTYSHETLEMIREGAWARAGLYALGSVALGIAAVAVGAGAAGGLPPEG